MAKNSFKKGNKAAKGGARPNAGRKTAELKRLEMELFDDELVNAAVRKIRAKVNAGDIDACKFVIERKFGKARQNLSVDVTGSNIMPLLIATKAAVIAQAAAKALPGRIVHTQGVEECTSQEVSPSPRKPSSRKAKTSPAS